MVVTVTGVMSMGATVVVLSVVLVPVGVGSALVVVSAGLIIPAGVVAVSCVIGGSRVVWGQCRISIVAAAVVVAVASASIAWTDVTGGDGQSAQ